MKNIGLLYSDKSKFLKILFPLSVLLLCGLSILLVKRIDDMSEAAEEVNRTNIARLALSETLSKLKDAEADQRGYLLTKDSAFLTHFSVSSKKLYTHLGNLRILVSSNEKMLAHVDKLHKLIDTRLDLLKVVLAEHKDNVIFNKAFRTELSPGRTAMASVEAQLNLMDQLLGESKQRQMAASNWFVASTPLYTAILTLSALLIISYAFYSLNRQLKLSEKYLEQSRAAEEKVRKTNLLLENAEQITNSGSWEWNNAKQTVAHSDNLFRLYGYEPGGFEPGLFDFMPLIDAADRKEMMKKMDEDRRAGRVSTYNFWVTRKDGERRYFQSISHFGKNEEGEDVTIGTTEDITEKHLLRLESEQRARFTELVVENNVDMIAAFDKELRVTVWNRAYEDMFGVAKEKILGKKLTDVFPYLEGDIKMVYLRAALRGKEIKRTEFQYFKNQRTGEISIIPLKNDAGTVTGVLTAIHDVTEIKQAERLLKESNQRFEYAEEAGNMGSFYLDLSTNEVNVSCNLYRLFGLEPYSIAPSLERFFTERVHPDDREAIFEAFKKLKQTGLFTTEVARIIRKDGVVRYIKCSAIPSENEKGERVLFGNILDITDETLLKQQLQERKRLAETLVENSADMIEVIDTQMRYTVWNKANEEQFGLSKKEVLGRKITDVFPSIAENKRMEFIKAGLTGIATYGVEQPYLNGQRTGDFSYIPLQHADGSIMGLLIMAHDITEKIKAAQKLKKANDELFYRNQALQEAYLFNRHITDLAPNAIYVFDLKKGIPVFANKRIFEALGNSESELARKDSSYMAEVIHPDDMPVIMNNFKRFKEAKDQDVHELEYRIKNSQGEYRRYYGWETVFKRDATGEVEQIIGMALDITDLRTAERELKEKNIALQQSNEELSSFNYIASHDLQEPLRKIQTFGNFLEETETGLSEAGKSSLKRMQMAAARMRNLINDLLSFSRISMLEEEMGQVDLNEVLKQARSTLRASLKETGATIVACELPAVKGVSFQLQQLLENVIGNAVKYCAPGIAPVVTITTNEISAEHASSLGLEPGWTYHCISVQDNGIGFEQQYAGKIFELFQRLHTKNEYPGTGLGLAICKKIVLNHGGYIQATSQPGKGSRFEIFLPAARILETA